MTTKIWTSLGAVAVVLAAAVTYWLKYEDWVTLPAARAMISAQMKDPDSTKFRSDRFTKSGWLCGELNAKNSMGGYVGFKRFISGGANGVFYIEGEGRLGELTAEEVIALTDKETEIIESLIKQRAADPTFKPASAEERREMALSQRFKERWKEICHS